jgi:predicted ribosomally synthesized peptide with nif11-like leader
MSKQAAVDFVTKTAEDPALKEKVRSKGASYSDERLANAVAVGNAAGFEFTADEFRAVMSAAKDAEQEGELTEDDLAGVVGGAAWYAEVWAVITDLMNGTGGAGIAEGENAVAGVRG